MLTPNTTQTVLWVWFRLQLVLWDSFSQLCSDILQLSELDCNGSAKNVSNILIEYICFLISHLCHTCNFENSTDQLIHDTESMTFKGECIRLHAYTSPQWVRWYHGGQVNRSSVGETFGVTRVNWSNNKFSTVSCLLVNWLCWMICCWYDACVGKVIYHISVFLLAAATF